MSNKNLPFYFFVSLKNQTLCTRFLLTGPWNLSKYFGCFPEIFTRFLEFEAAIERCTTKVVVQQNDVMKYSSSAPVVKNANTLHADLLKIKLHHRYFFKI